MSRIIMDAIVFRAGSHGVINRSRAPTQKACLFSRSRHNELVRSLRKKHALEYVRVHSSPPDASASSTEADLSRRYHVMLALVARLLALPDKKQLHNFLTTKSDAVSVPFLLWIADQEASAVGEQKRVLSGICEELVRFREQLESDRMDALYADTLVALTEGESDPGAAALALAERPEQYAAKLAQRVTGSAVLTDGFNPVYDVLLKVAPPAALTPEGVAKGHDLARELAIDLRSRRKRSVQSMIGRAQLTPEQADKLLAGSNASRILDMLLTLPSSTDRLACLPDCFTPPDDNVEVDTGVQAMAASSPASDSDELVWCTPSQLLLELEARLQRLEGQGPRLDSIAAPGPQVFGVPDASSLTGEELLSELRLLRAEVRRTWLETLEVEE